MAEIRSTYRFITARTQIRELDASDRDLYCQLYGSPQTMQFIAPALTEQQAQKAFLNELKSANKFPRRRYVFSVIETSSVDRIGIVALVCDKENCQSAELGCMFLPTATGKKFAFECMRRMMQFAFEQLQLTELWGEHSINHVRSTKLMRDLGFGLCDAKRPELGPNRLSESLIRDDWKLLLPQDIAECHGQTKHSKFELN